MKKSESQWSLSSSLNFVVHFPCGRTPAKFLDGVRCFSCGAEMPPELAYMEDVQLICTGFDFLVYECSWREYNTRLGE